LTWAKLGTAQAELGDFAGAIASLEQALDGRKSSYPVETVERLANIKVRQAQKLRRAGDDHMARAVELFSEADQLISALLAIRRTAERLALKASYHKKRAASLFDRRCAGSSAEQELELRAARDAYREAAEVGRDKYHVLNDFQLSRLLGEARLDEAQPRIEAAFASTGSDERVQAEFTGYWDRVADADRRLSTRLLEGGLADCARELHDAYDGVFGERSTWKERDSTIDHLWDLSRLHPDEAEANAREELWRALQQEWQGDK
jgi:tetratricopeptide (TPR) repeat protein